MKTNGVFITFYEENVRFYQFLIFKKQAFRAPAYPSLETKRAALKPT
jgi:hypothetical protein